MSNHLPGFMGERASEKREGEREKDHHFAGNQGKENAGGGILMMTIWEMIWKNQAPLVPFTPDTIVHERCNEMELDRK